MPQVVSRGGQRGRRTMSEINMVPFIDVMLVLLIIFMVSAPLITTGVVDVPSVGKARQAPSHVIEVMIAQDESLQVKLDGHDSQPASLASVVTQIKARLRDDMDMPVIISADRGVRYESVVKVMDLLQRAGLRRVGLSVKTTA